MANMLNMNEQVVSISEEPFAYKLFPKYKKVKKWTPEVVKEFCYDFYLFSEGLLAAQFGTYQDLETILMEHLDYLDVYSAIKLAFLCFFPNKDKSNVTTLIEKELKSLFFLEELAAIYPDARFIVLYRDPRDNALTKWKRATKGNRRASYFKYGFVWNYTFSGIREKALKIGKARFMHVKYEDLVSNPEDTLKQICLFLEIRYNSVMLEHDAYFRSEMKDRVENMDDKLKRQFRLFHQGLAQKVNTDKIGLWKSSMKPEDANLVWTLSANSAREVGYLEDEDFKEIKWNPILRFRQLYWTIRLVWFPKMYFALPFSVKYAIKKVKYGYRLRNETDKSNSDKLK
ncbi:MAG: sulfotransferase [Bacteroidetes bacterium]|nr:sulfotransferase [Bacteroidota bacterium]